MKQLIISCSLSPKSRSAVLAEALRDAAASLGDDATLIDLRRTPLPFCDAGECYADENVGRLKAAIAAADAVAIATPIYNYETGGGTRNLIALTGDSWKGKVVGFLCAAGGQGSYMAVMSLANSLMLDFRCHIVPRFVYATEADFDKATNALTSEEIGGRVKELAGELHRVGTALAM
jgi:FMN reductase